MIQCTMVTCAIMRRFSIDSSELIKKVRLELCYSQEGLASELHVGFTSVNRWESNHAKPNQITHRA